MSEKNEYIQRLRDKPDVDLLVAEVIEDDSYLPLLLEIIRTEPSAIKFTCTKIIRKVSEQKPELIYPHFEDIARWIRQPNSFIKWDGILTLSNLVAVDRDNRFEKIYKDFFELLTDPQMITAANVAGNAWKIVLARPSWESDITRRLLEVPRIVYLDKGEPSPECNRIACGHVLECFDHYYARSSNQAAMIRFAEEQRQNPRKAVAKIAEEFLQRNAR